MYVCVYVCVVLSFARKHDLNREVRQQKQKKKQQTNLTNGKRPKPKEIGLEKSRPKFRP